MPPDSEDGARTATFATERGGAAGSDSTPMGAGHGRDWPSQAAGKVEEAVSLVRDRAVRPITKGVRYLIFAVLAGAVALLLLVLLAVFALRVLDTEVPVFRTRVWASYLVLAGIFWVAGLLLTRMRHRRN